MNRHLVTSALTTMLLPVALAAGPWAAPAQAAPARPALEPGNEPGGSAGDPGLGTWSVTPAGTDTWTVTWRSPERLPVTADRPTVVAADQLGGVAQGTPLGVPTVADDGRTVEVTVTSTTEPSPDQLDVVLSGAVLDEGIVAGIAEPGADRWTEPERDLLPVDPGVAGPLQTTTSDYELDGIKVPRMPEKIEMKGHVVEPEVADPTAPLVLFLHGRHSYCYNPDTGRMGWRWPCAGQQVPIPSELGYDYIQKVLASQGYVTVSIAANGINAQDGNAPDGGAAARSQLIQAHLDLWASSWAADNGHQADLDKVVLVGHSRGGEGVSRASLEIPLSAPYRIVGQVLIGPTNFARQTTPYVPTVTVLPSCDGDVSDLQGQTYTDLSRGLATGDTAMKSSIMVVGANHNFFNTEWTPGIAAAPAFDDWGGSGGVCGKGTPTRLTAAEERRVGKAYVAGAVHLFADGEQDYRPMFDGSAVRVGSTGDAVVLSHMLGGDREYRVPGAQTGLTTPVDAETLLCKGVTRFGHTDKPTCGRYAKSPEATPHWPTEGSLVPTYRAFQMSWEQSGAEGGLTFSDPLDLSGSDWLDLRTVVDPKVGDVGLQVRLTDAGGDATVVDPAGGDLLPALPTGDRFSPGKYWAQTLRVDVADLAGIDAGQVTKVELLGTSDRGRLWVIDLAAASAVLPAVPAERVPLVDLGRVRVDEGGPGTQVAEVPFEVTGDVTRPSVFRVYGFDTPQQTGRPAQLDVDVLPGDSEGTVSWEYPGDDLDSYPRVSYQLIGHGMHDVVVRDSEGQVMVIDDDPTPDISFDAVRPRAAEGRDAVFDAILSAPSGKEVGVLVRILRGDGSTEPLRASDVDRKWLRSWTDFEPGTDPYLYEMGQGLWDYVRSGKDRIRFRIPIRADGKPEPVESLTVRASSDDGWRSDPITVLVPAH